MVMKRGPGSLLAAIPMRLPMLVDNPARVVNIKAMPTFGVTRLRPSTKMAFSESVGPKDSNHGKLGQEFNSMGCFIQAAGQILSGSVQRLVAAVLPKETVGHIVDLALIGHVRRGSVLTVVVR